MFIDFSISEIKQTALNSAKRFPWVVLILNLCSMLSCLLILDSIYFSEYQDFIKFVFVLYLGIPISIGLSLFKESIKDTLAKSILHPVFKNIIKWELDVLLIILIFLSLIYFSVPSVKNNGFGFKFIQIAIIVHLFVSLAPFLNIKKKENLEFWSYNYFLLRRIIKANIYAVTFWIGLSLAILVVNLLFNTNLSKAFGYLAVFSTVFFQTWFFISGIPEKTKTISNDFSYPNELRVFTQFALVPITAIYLIILYAYTLKILIQWNIPSGYISWLVSSISILGTIALLLIHPIRHNLNFKWVNLFWKYYFILILPLLGLLFYALFLRISDYGLTESRVVLFICGFALLILSIYFSLVKNENIKWIPFSLMIFGLITFMGPLDATKLSFNSQINKLVSYIKKYNMINIESLDKITAKDAGSISSIINYIDSRNSSKAKQLLEEKFSWAVDIKNKNLNSSGLDIKFFLMNKLSKQSSQLEYNVSLNLRLDSLDVEPLSFKNAKLFLPIEIYSYNNIKNIIKVNDKEWSLNLISDKLILNQKISDDFFDISFQPLFDMMRDQAKSVKQSEIKKIPKEFASYKIDFKDLKGSFILNEITIEIKDSQRKIINLSGIILLN